MKKSISIAITLVLAISILSGCSAADVVLKYSPESFDKILKEFSDLVTDTTTTDHYYNLTVDGDTVLKVSHDYDLTGANDIEIVTPLKPFVDAGLDVSKLTAGYLVEGDNFVLTADYGKGNGMQDNVTDSLFESVKFERKMLTYHEELDHYGIKLLNGKFEYAKDYSTNDKDLVFVIAAKPLADIGVDVQNIEGWVFKTMKEPDGSDMDVLLKPYDLIK